MVLIQILHPLEDILQGPTRAQNTGTLRAVSLRGTEGEVIEVANVVDVGNNGITKWVTIPTLPRIMHPILHQTLCSTLHPNFLIGLDPHLLIPALSMPRGLF